MARIRAGCIALAILALLLASGAGRRASGQTAPGPQTVTFDDVLKLLELQIDEKAILARLQKSPTLFKLDARQVEQLRQAGATPAIIAALSERPVATGGDVTDFAILLDCSGSMLEKTAEGRTKMDVAQRVVADLVQQVPNGLRLTFIIYGHDKQLACKAVKIVRELAEIDDDGKSRLIAEIIELRPAGSTPIALGLRTAALELAKNDSCCSLVIISDGKETCQGDPAAEAATIAANLKISDGFGVNVVGFDVGEDRESLESIARAGKGKYYSADNADELAESMSKISQELQVVAKPPKKNVSNRRAIKVLKPEVDFPPYVEIQVVSRGLGSISVVAKGQYGEEIRIPSSTEKYEIRWVPKTGIPVAILKEFTLTERKVIEIKPEEHLGMIQVNGSGAPTKGIQVFQRGLGSFLVLQKCQEFGEIMVVPAETVNISVDDDVLEEGLKVEAGTLHELE